MYYETRKQVENVRDIRVNGSTFESRNCTFNEAGFIQSISVDVDLAKTRYTFSVRPLDRTLRSQQATFWKTYLHVVLVSDRKSPIDRLWSSSPIFVQLQANRTSLNHIFLSLHARARVIALTRKSKVQGDAIGGGHHRLHVELARGAGRSVGSC